MSFCSSSARFLVSCCAANPVDGATNDAQHVGTAPVEAQQLSALRILFVCSPVTPSSCKHRHVRLRNAKDMSGSDCCDLPGFPITIRYCTLMVMSYEFQALLHSFQSPDQGVESFVALLLPRPEHGRPTDFCAMIIWPGTPQICFMSKYE